MMELRMADEGISGVERERRQRVQRLILFAALGLAGGIIGFTFAMYEDKQAVWASGAIPPGIAIVLALVTLIATVGGSWLYCRRMDEVELKDNLHGGAWAALVVMIGYPVWYLLWKGGLASEPSHIVMFLTLYGVTTAVYLYRKLR